MDNDNKRIKITYDDHREIYNRKRCNKCNNLFNLDAKGRRWDYYSLKGTQLSSSRGGRAFRYCGPCFKDLKVLIGDYIKTEHGTLCQNKCAEHCQEGKK